MTSTYNTWPTPVVASGLSLKIGSLLIIENPTKAIWNPWWNVGNSFQWAMLCHSIDNVLSWSCPQCFLVCHSNRSNRRILDVLVVACKAGRVIWSLVVVTSKAGCIESIDDVGTLEILLPKMRSTVSSFLIIAYSIKWSVRHVPRVSLPKRAAACKSTALR
jgi:hypothetical protein|tara:strand:+ start:428 stop:910 length:483 start_codon:yes stop_codon:yes gene_type:complete